MFLLSLARTVGDASRRANRRGEAGVGSLSGPLPLALSRLRGFLGVFAALAEGYGFARRSEGRVSESESAS